MSPAHSSVQLPATATDLTPGDPADIGPYRLVKRLGAGGMGVVYAAQGRDGAPVAVKVIHPEYAADPEFRGRFAREVDMLSRVGGACAVPLLASDAQGTRPWLATPLVRGLALNAYLRESGGRLPAPLLPGLAVGIAEALAQIHAAGVVHRDLKPANIMMAPEGPRVLDFGIARALDQTALTRTGSLLGSSGWISPAHYRGEPVSTADDIFTWGALVTYAATGRRPFGTGDPAAVAHRVMNEEPDMEGFTGPIASLARQALSKAAARRPSAMALVIALTQLADLERPPTPIASAAAAENAVTATLRATWHGVRTPEEREVAVPGRCRGGRTGLRVASVVAALVLLAGVSLGGVAITGHWGSLPFTSWFGAGAEPGDDGEGAGGTAPSGAEDTGEDAPADTDDRDSAGSGTGQQGSDGDAEGATAGGGSGPHTVMATVGAGVDASGTRPSGTHVVAFRPANGSGMYGVLDDATVVCAWSFCQGEGGSVAHGDAGSVPSDPAALTDHVDTGSRTITAEVTYTEETDGTATITELVEHHSTSGTGTPPW
ncbi:serine/threonine-protein kinase [Nocardiopsis sp. MG754419]|uniref:serine/threonine-protein kinase n=1 Tax=Nocardiopsis sp. MG754419 TaxID=2259865 RepID=UPI001BA91653|nr:serine/threonine-protein kinase [Nocardiopsis sp. MG754419]MBR8741664.1 serine/threonine protein kinase [Nocardiopsis sp. MG754419]